jgi:hypothetical protein
MKSFKKVASSKNRREEGFGLPMDIEPDIRVMFHLSPLKHLHLYKIVPRQGLSPHIERLTQH